MSVLAPCRPFACSASYFSISSSAIDRATGGTAASDVALGVDRDGHGIARRVGIGPIGADRGERRRAVVSAIEGKRECATVSQTNAKLLTSQFG